MAPATHTPQQVDYYNFSLLWLVWRFPTQAFDIATFHSRAVSVQTTLGIHVLSPLYRREFGTCISKGLFLWGNPLLPLWLEPLAEPSPSRAVELRLNGNMSLAPSLCPKFPMAIVDMSTVIPLGGLLVSLMVSAQPRASHAHGLQRHFRSLSA